MAAVNIQSRLTKVGAVIKQELWPSERYCRTVKTVTKIASTTGTAMQVGALLEDATWVAAASVANVDGILIDNNIDNLTVGASADLAVLTSGPAVVATSALEFQDHGTVPARTSFVALDATIRFATSV